MILIIGGAFQGKRKCSREVLGITSEEYEQGLADGYTDHIGQALHSRYIAAYHLFLRKAMEEGKDPHRYTCQVIDGNPRIVSMDEVGYGIVPMEASDRVYREAVGRCGQILAEKADMVYRVICGIPVKIK